MPKWLVYSFVTFAVWGVWGAVTALADNAGVPALENLVLFTAGLLPVAIGVGLSPGVTVGTAKRRGLLWGFLTGFSGGLGNIAFYSAMSQGGRVSIVLPLTGLYPLVTILIARVAMRERLNRAQVVGIAGAIAALVVINATAETWRDPAAFARSLGTEWMAYTLAAIVFWGFTGVTQKLATNHVSAELSLLGFVSGFVPLAAAVLLFGDRDWEFGRPVLGWTAAVLGGSLLGFGTLTSLAAYRHGGKASVVTPLTGLYPALTVVLVLLIPTLQERLEVREVVGIVIALAAAIALSYEPAVEPTKARGFEPVLADTGGQPQG